MHIARRRTLAILVEPAMSPPHARRIDANERNITHFTVEYSTVRASQLDLIHPIAIGMLVNRRQEFEHTSM